MLRDMAFGIALILGLFGGGTAIGCHFQVITADPQGLHPLTFAQVWHLAPRCPMDNTCPVKGWK